MVRGCDSATTPMDRLDPRFRARSAASRSGATRQSPAQPRRLALLTLLATPLLSLSAWASTSASRIEVAINGMVCSFCVQGIERKIRELPATQAVKVDIQKHLVDITLRQGQTIGDDQLRKLIRDAGFDVRTIKRIQANP